MDHDNRDIERQMRMKALAGVMDFFGVIACALMVVALIALLTNLFAWLVTDLTQSFSELQKSVTEAIIIQ